MAGCASKPTAPAVARPESVPVSKLPSRPEIGERAATVALQQVGVPYRYGGSTPSGFDCSGLVHYSYASVGKNIPRTTTGLWDGLAPIDNRNMRVGDLLFFSISGKMSHVGMYLGGGRFVHAPSSGKVVSIENLGSDYYRRAFIRAGRPR
jgi:cell wall-associated NlpC family hydrolase